MRKHSILTAVLLLEVAAHALAYLQLSSGLVSDEAKYLLSIPYPHPPFLRSFLGWTAGMPMHEFFWRFVFASSLMQAVWFVWDLGAVLTRSRRIVLACSWLLCGAVILQSGMITMATGAALSGLVFVWWTLHPDPPRKPAMIACLWLISLFTAYQSALYLPLVLSALLRSEKSRTKVLLYVCVPLVLLTLYTLTNPYALSLMFHLSGQDAVLPPLTRFLAIGWVWIAAGSGLLSLVGTIGILSSVRIDLVTAFGLLFGYVILSSASYYAILFTPLLIGGLFLLFCKRRLHPPLFLIGQCLCTAVVVFLSFPTPKETPAHAQIQAVRQYSFTGAMLIDGFFGHDWQYLSPVPVLRFSQLLSRSAEMEAGIFVCTKDTKCYADVNEDMWRLLPDTPYPTWIRKNSGG